MHNIYGGRCMYCIISKILQNAYDIAFEIHNSAKGTQIDYSNYQDYVRKTDPLM